MNRNSAIEMGSFAKSRHPFAMERKGNLGSCFDDGHRDPSKLTGDIVAFVGLAAIAVAVVDLNCAVSDAVDRG